MAASEHPTCLGCGKSFWQHDPDDPDGCELWQPSTAATSQ